MASSARNLQLLRSLIREIRHSTTKRPVRETMAYQYVMEQFRSHQTTTKKICRDQKEMEHLGRTYLCLLQSSRLHEILHNTYKGKGDRSTEDSARLVGLNVPDMPQS